MKLRKEILKKSARYYLDIIKDICGFICVTSNQNKARYFKTLLLKTPIC